jgi:hypothetical protein
MLLCFGNDLSTTSGLALQTVFLPVISLLQYVSVQKYIYLKNFEEKPELLEMHDL